MTISPSDLQWYHSSESGSRGGAISNNVVDSNTIHDLFDHVSEDESFDSHTEYRIIYLKNNSSTNDALNVRVFFDVIASVPQGSTATTYISIGKNEAAGTTAQILANDTDEPTGSIAFSRPTSRLASSTPPPLNLGTIAQGSWRAVYLKRELVGSATRSAADSALERLRLAVGSSA